MPAASPNANIIIREHGGQPFYEAKFRHAGRQVKRRIGPAWLDRDPKTGVWVRRRGRVADGAYDERGAIVAAAELVAAHVAEAVNAEQIEHERRTRGATFREVGHAYMRWMADVAGAKPSTLRDRERCWASQGYRANEAKARRSGT